MKVFRYPGLAIAVLTVYYPYMSAGTASSGDTLSGRSQFFDFLQSWRDSLPPSRTTKAPTPPDKVRDVKRYDDRPNSISISTTTSNSSSSSSSSSNNNNNDNNNDHGVGRSMKKKVTIFTAASAAPCVTATAGSRSGLAAVVSKITRVMLPFGPLVIEAPAIVSHATLGWPWLRAVFPYCCAFVLPPINKAPWDRQQQWQKQQKQQPQQRVSCRPQIVGRSSIAMVEFQNDPFALDGRKLPASPQLPRQQHHHNAPGTNIAPSLWMLTVESGICDEATAQDVSSRSSRKDELQPQPAAKNSVQTSRDFAPTGAVGKVTRRRAVFVFFAVVWFMMMGRLGFDNGGRIRTAAAAVLGGKDGAEGNGGARSGSEREGESSSTAFIKKSYDDFADGYDDLDGGWVASAIGVEDLRAQLLSRATGRVLEVGVGTGLNLRHYRRDSVTAIDAIDLSPGMLSQASTRLSSLHMGDMVRLKEMDVEHLDFPSGTFDTVVDTFSLCVFPNPSAALQEMARVCKPTGRVLLLENSKSAFAPLGAYQDLTATYLAKRGGAKGCFWNQDVEALARGAGLLVDRTFSVLPGGLFRMLECVPNGERQ